MTVIPRGVGGMGAYKGRGASRSMAMCRGESGTGVEAMIVSRRARTLGCSMGDTVKTSSRRGLAEGGGVARTVVARTSTDGSSRSSRTWDTWWMGRKRKAGSMTSFICCFQMYQRNEPRAHSLARLDFPRRRRTRTGIEDRDSRGLSAMTGNQKGAGHSQGHKDL